MMSQVFTLSKVHTNCCNTEREHGVMKINQVFGPKFGESKPLQGLLMWFGELSLIVYQHLLSYALKECRSNVCARFVTKTMRQSCIYWLPVRSLDSVGY